MDKKIKILFSVYMPPPLPLPSSPIPNPSLPNPPYPKSLPFYSFPYPIFFPFFSLPYSISLPPFLPLYHILPFLYPLIPPLLHLLPTPSQTSKLVMGELDTCEVNPP